MHGVPPQQVVEPGTVGAVHGKRPGLREQGCERGLRLLGQQEAAQAAGGVGQGGRDGVVAIEPDRAGRGGRGTGRRGGTMRATGVQPIAGGRRGRTVRTVRIGGRAGAVAPGRAARGERLPAAVVATVPVRGTDLRTGPVAGTRERAVIGTRAAIGAACVGPGAGCAVRLTERARRVPTVAAGTATGSPTGGPTGGPTGAVRPAAVPGPVMAGMLLPLRPFRARPIPARPVRPRGSRRAVPAGLVRSGGTGAGTAAAILAGGGSERSGLLRSGAAGAAKRAAIGGRAAGAAMPVMGGLHRCRYRDNPGGCPDRMVRALRLGSSALFSFCRSCARRWVILAMMRA